MLKLVSGMMYGIYASSPDWYTYTLFYFSLYMYIYMVVIPIVTSGIVSLAISIVEIPKLYGVCCRERAALEDIWRQEVLEQLHGLLLYLERLPHLPGTTLTARNPLQGQVGCRGGH